MLKIIHLYIFKITGFILLSILLSKHIIAQPGIISEKSLSPKQNYVIKFWNSENGLPQNSILKILQTQNGYLWVSTYNGLLRFDGNSFELFNTTNTPILPHNSFIDLFEDSKQNLWLVSPNQKLAKYSNGKFEVFSIDEKSYVNAVCENGDNEILAGLTTGKIHKVINGEFVDFINVGTYIRKLVYSKNQELYIATDKGLYVYKNNKLNVVEELRGVEIYILKKGLKNEILVLSDKGLLKIENGILSTINLPLEPLVIKHFKDVLIEENDRIWLASENGALIIENDTYTYCDINSGLSSNEISALYKDKEDNIWIGTVNGGLNKLKPKIIKIFSKEDGLMEDISRPILQLKNQDVLISHCNKITQWKNGQFSLFNKGYVGCVWTMMEENNGDIWFGTFNEGLYKYSEGRFSKIDSKEMWMKNSFYALLQDKDGVIWIGNDLGLSTFQNNKFQKVFEDKITGAITNIFQDSKNRIWFCSNKGLGAIENGNVKIYTIDDGLSNNNVRQIYEDKEGVLWIATYGGGISRFKNNTFFSFNESEKIIDGFTSCIVEDNDNNLWISSNRGIYSASRKSLNDYADGKSLFMNVRYFGKEDGMKSSECNGGFQYAGLKMNDGKILFPTANGIALINPRTISENNYIPKVIIQGIEADDISQNIYDSVITINNDTRKIVIHFTAPFFGDSKNLLFEYKLEGYDQAWNKPDNNRSVSYSNLPPGDYVFKIAVYGYINEQSIVIRIPSPFWKTGKFYALLAIFSTLVFFTVVYFRTKKIRKKEAFNTEINKQYAALELKALQGQMNPHFMFNCLNTIKYFITTDNKAAANKYLGKFSKLIRLFLEHTNSNTIPLSEEIHILSLYIEMEQLRLDNSFDFRLNIDPTINMEGTEIPTMLLQPFVENAIHHGLRNLTKKGVLNLSVIFENDLIITIDDNGIGRKKSAELKQISAKEHTSMGMKLTEERIETLNYIKNTQIKLEIIDKINSDNEAEGTKIVITIPQNHPHHD